MIKKLRLKFIIINMTIILIMMSVLMSVLYYTTARNLENDSIQSVNSIQIDPEPMRQQGPGGNMNNGPDSNRNLPYFCITVDENGNITDMSSNYYEMSDEDSLNEVLQSAVDMGTETGEIDEYNLRFVRRVAPNGKTYIFTDISVEKSTLESLVETLAFAGIAALVALLCIVILLSKWAVSPVEKAWKQQKQFVADASHELKTPLTVIMTDAELLHDEGCTEKERNELSGSIITMSGQMRGLVESLLELARIDAGSVKEATTKVNFSDTASDSAMMFEPVFFEKGMNFSYEIEPDIIIDGNAAHLKQLTDIFLDNAAKYASPGGETIMKLKKTSSKKCVLSVSDQGEPIPEEEIKNLFKRFYRVDKSRTSCHSYGLGLSIAESVVSEHKGKIKAESKNGWNTFSAEFTI